MANTFEHARRHIALVGLSGAGKSSVARLLGRELGLPVVDTDREVERSAGMPVQRIFTERGEAEFRRLETIEVRRALTGPRAVVSLGGGAVLDPENRRIIWERAVVVWLEAAPAALAARLRGTGERRPLLEQADPEVRLRELLEQRRPYYAEAHLRVDTTERTPEEVAEYILRGLSAVGEGPLSG